MSEGAEYSRIILKGFFNNFEDNEDAIFYLTKGLEMILHELQNEYDNKSQQDHIAQHRINRLRRCIDELKGTA